MRNCERCYDSYFCNYSGNLWDHCPACRRSILDVQDRRHYDAVQQQLQYAYGWGYNIEYDVAQITERFGIRLDLLGIMHS
jgi:hypothetical protein